MSKLLFARYSIANSVKIENKQEFLLKGLENIQKIESRNLVYRFSSVSTFDTKSNIFITGYLVKYKPEDEEEVYNEISDSVQTEKLSNKMLGRSRFLIHPASSIIIFKEIPNTFPMKAFIDKFTALFEKNHGGFMTEIYLEPIKEQYSFIERLKSFKKIEKIEITLFPSNPNYGERWKSIDQRLRNNNITKFKETQENKKTNASIIIDEETENKFLMSEDGYGEAKASGIDNTGENVKISTKKSAKNISLNVDSSIENATQIFNLVANTLQGIIERTNNSK